MTKIVRNVPKNACTSSSLPRSTQSSYSRFSNRLEVSSLNFITHFVSSSIFLIRDFFFVIR